MHVIIAILYLIFFCVERSRLAKEREREERKKKKREDKRAREEAFRKAKKEYDNQVFERWTDLVCDLELERKVWLYMLDEKNFPEYGPWLQKIYDSFDGPRIDVSKMQLTRMVHNPARINSDPLEYRWGTDKGQAARERAAALMMVERGKIPERIANTVWFAKDGTDTSIGNVMRYLASRLSQKTGEDIGYKEYGLQWTRLEVRRIAEYYWVHNGILVFQHSNPEFCWMEEKKLAEKLKYRTAADDPEDIRYVQNEIERMNVDYERRYQHLKDGETH